MNMNALMQQAQRMQRDIEKKQKEINSTEYVGESQLVDVILMGDKTMKSVIWKGGDDFDKSDLDILLDMIKIAHDDAVRKIEKDQESKMGPYAKQLGGLI